MSQNVAFAHRPTILACNGLAATGHPLATLAAVEVLRGGGNAVDAAVAAAGVLAVVLPDKCGLGGDVFALIYRTADGSIVALNASGTAPERVEPLVEQGIPDTGPRAATVPGAVAGWADLVERFGTRPLAELLQPAIRYARHGFPIGGRLAGLLKVSRSLLASFPTTSRVFLPAGALPRAGDVLVQADLADSLEVIAREGRSAFYQGALTRAIVAASRAHGGLLSEGDFAAHSSVWADPLSTTYRGCRVVGQPPVSQGHILLEELNVVEGDDLAGLGHNSTPLVHLMVEAKKLAFTDRFAFLGDPTFVDIPLTRLLSKDHARRLRQRIDPARAASGVPSPRAPAETHTTYLAVVDPDGNAVSFIQSIFGDFGGGFVAGRTGILLNSRATGFSLDPKSPNVLRPRKRPVHTLHACLVLNAEGAPLCVLGTPGDNGQVQTVFQLLVNLLDFEMDVQAAIEQPRWRSQAGTRLLLESRFERSTAEQLAALGHQVELVGAWDTRMGGAQLIKIDRRRGVLHGGADPRREGYALGW